MRTLLVVLAILLATTAPAAGAAPVRASATIDRNSVTIGDQILLSLTVETDAGYGIVDSGVGRTVGDFDVIETVAPQLTKIANGGSRYVFRYRIAAFRVGAYILPPIQVAYQGPGGERGIAPTAELPIVVASVLRAGESLDDVKPLKPQLRLPMALAPGRWFGHDGQGDDRGGGVRQPTRARRWPVSDRSAGCNRRVGEGC